MSQTPTGGTPSFASVFGTRRGRKHRFPLAHQARALMSKRGMVPSAPIGDVAQADVAVARALTCPECGQHGLVGENFMHAKGRRITLTVLVLLALAIIIGFRLAHIGAGGIVAAVVLITGWHLARDFLQHSLMVCPCCRSTQRSH